jgi:excisionase family DNA binding protein
VRLDRIARISAPSSFEPRVGRSVSLDQAAGFLGVSRRTIYNWIRAGRLRTIRTLGGGSQRVLLASLHEMAGARPNPGGPVVGNSTGPIALS